MTRSLNDLAGSLRQAEGRCVVLMGAGCSLSAGIPLASALIQEIRTKYPEAYARSLQGQPENRPSYNEVMEQLSLNERQSLLNRYIEQAKVNWAHLALAQLFANQKIDRVLTVNFDPLLVKACSLVNFFPAIYDLAGTDRFKSHRIAPQSLFYLNGQHTGFVMLNGQDELDAHRQKLKTVVGDTGVRRLWLVVGYSGEADPLLDVLAEQDCFDGDLYWLGHSPEPSTRLLQSQLFQRGRHAFYVGGQDADICLTTLAQQLGCFPPDLLVRPHVHLQSLMDHILFETGGLAAQAIQTKLQAQLGRFVELAQAESGVTHLEQAERWMLAGQYQSVIDWFDQLTAEQKSDPALDLASWAWVMQGSKLAEEAQAVAAQDLGAARVLWQQAGEKYAQALKIKPDKHEAVNNWGNALGQEALAVAAQDLGAARVLWQQVGDKFAQALKLKPDKHNAAYNWGLALCQEAQAVATQDLCAARVLWQQAGDKFAQALKLKPDDHQTANNWGNALGQEAQAVAAPDLDGARVLWQQAGDKFAQALKLKPDVHEAANNWGLALEKEAQAVATQDLGAARALWQQAGEKYAQALKIKPDMYDAAHNWAVALGHEAQAVAAQDLVAAQVLWQQAGEKYAQALKIKPDKHEAAHNWGLALCQEVQVVVTQDLGLARVLWQRAGDKFAQALQIKPDLHDAANNWGIALGQEAQAVAAQDLGTPRALWQQAGEKYAQALKIKPDMHEAANNWGLALGQEAQAVAAHDPGAARVLWQQAGEKYAQALKIQPDKHDAANNWGVALIHEAQALLTHQLKDEADPVLTRAATLLEQHVAAWPDVRGQLAYNLACVYGLQHRATDAVAQLETARKAQKLPDHWRTDPDLDPIRTSADHQAWVAQHFPNPIPTDTNASKGT